LGASPAAGYSYAAMQRLARAYTSDLAMAASVILAIQLFGVLAVVQVVQSFS